MSRQLERKNQSKKEPPRESKIMITKKKEGDGISLPKSDAILNCPACMVALSLDCQRWCCCWWFYWYWILYPFCNCHRSDSLDLSMQTHLDLHKFSCYLTQYILEHRSVLNLISRLLLTSVVPSFLSVWALNDQIAVTITIFTMHKAKLLFKQCNGLSLAFKIQQFIITRT